MDCRDRGDRADLGSPVGWSRLSVEFLARRTARPSGRVRTGIERLSGYRVLFEGLGCRRCQINLLSQIPRPRQLPREWGLRSRKVFTESLILAQDERWRRA